MCFVYAHASLREKKEQTDNKVEYYHLEIDEGKKNEREEIPMDIRLQIEQTRQIRTVRDKKNFYQ